MPSSVASCGKTKKIKLIERADMMFDAQPAKAKKRTGTEMARSFRSGVSSSATWRFAVLTRARAINGMIISEAPIASLSERRGSTANSNPPVDCPSSIPMFHDKQYKTNGWLASRLTSPVRWPAVSRAMSGGKAIAAAIPMRAASRYASGGSMECRATAKQTTNIDAPAAINRRRPTRSDR